MPIFGTVTDRDFWENPKHGSIYKVIQRYALDFSRKTRWVMVPLFGFFQDSPTSFHADMSKKNHEFLAMKPFDHSCVCELEV